MEWKFCDSSGYVVACAGKTGIRFSCTELCESWKFSKLFQNSHLPLSSAKREEEFTFYSEEGENYVECKLHIGFSRDLTVDEIPFLFALVHRLGNEIFGEGSLRHAPPEYEEDEE